MQSVGTLLIESPSSESLQYTLSRLLSFNHTYFTTNPQSKKDMFRLPIFRICSDPNIWPVENIMKYLSYEYPSELFAKANLSIHQYIPSSKEIIEILMSCESFDEQVSALYNVNCLTEQDILARFILCDSIEEILCCLFPDTKVSIFGSVINGLGSVNSDIDLVVELPANFKDIKHFSNNNEQMTDKSMPINPNVLLLDPGVLKDRFLSFLQFMLRRLDPLGFKQTRIYTGRIPILHVDQINVFKTGLDISWCVNNTTFNTTSSHCGVKMAEILRLLTLCVPGIQKAITMLKYIARELCLTRDGPNPEFTNFKLITLFINFLQSFIDNWVVLYNDDDVDTCSASDIHSYFCDLNPLPSMDVILDKFLSHICSLKPDEVIIDLRNGCLTSRSESQCNNAAHSITHFILCPDPTRPRHNIWSGISEKHWRAFVQICCLLQEKIKVNQHKKVDCKWGILANFLALCASDYYKGCIFHRNIKGFIVQTGDPTGTGKNGQSIWKKKFKDEFHDSLRHNARGIISMANNGPDSNGSQFFITYSKQTMLDMKYSIFGK
ncbi:unnamed protein product [Trichobilharzia regenti]|nr:unnamed protein product [Trichobilharzia regenti]